MKTDYFGAGCFWGAEYHFLEMNGVIDTRVGFMGGTHENPDYDHSYDYSEVVEITYDEKIVSYQELLDMFWKVHDATAEEVLESEERSKQNKKRKNNFDEIDEDIRYKSILFYSDENERKKAQHAKDELNDMHIFARPVITEVKKVSKFYPASEYHQKYFVKKYKKKRRFHIIFRMTIIGVTLLILFLLKSLK